MKMIDLEIGKKYLLTDGDIVEYRGEVKERIPFYKSYLVKWKDEISGVELSGIIGNDSIVSEAP